MAVKGSTILSPKNKYSTRGLLISRSYMRESAQFHKDRAADAISDDFCHPPASDKL